MPSTSLTQPFDYCQSLTEYSRRKTVEVKIGNLLMGSMHPIRVQSMTTIDTMDTQGSVEQAIRMIEAGCELVRITAPSIKEANNLAEIKKELVKRGYNTPLVADIHFTPNAAEVAARIVEKVRVNPGNYADKKRFETIEYTDIEYNNELQRIRDKFLPLVKICKDYGTAMRIGTNHGSLSDRIMSRYGDSPLGMVESALEFLKICEDENYYNIVISMKSSNTQVMVQAYRMLVNRLNADGFKPYPLHLGVTEAGEAEDGRIKSAVGIGTLLEDGLGDTVRVSLTEDPEFEMPVAKALVDRYNNRSGHKPIKSIEISPINPYQYNRRHTFEVANIGGSNVPRVIADFSQNSPFQNTNYEGKSALKSIGHFYFELTDKWNMNDLGADYIYTGGHPAPFMLPNGVKEIINFDTWNELTLKNHKLPLFDLRDGNMAQHQSIVVNNTLPKFIFINYKSLSDDFYDLIRNDKNAILLIDTNNEHAMGALRRLFFYLMGNKIDNPVVISRKYTELTDDMFQLYSATDFGGLLIDGFGDGVFISNENTPNADDIIRKRNNTVAFGILQAARTRISKTEYISCPSCGRTLFDLQETTAMIRKRTDHLKGLKIGIMGCIVNGPGEMADADFGYVGVGKDRIALYKGKEIIKKAVPAENALDELIDLIKSEGKWIEQE